MSTHIPLETTPRLHELATSLVLHGKKRVPTEEKDTELWVYDEMPDVSAATIAEIYSQKAAIRAAVPWAEVRIPTSRPTFFHHAKGVLRLEPNKIAVITIVGDPKALAEAKLRSWPSTQKESFTENKLSSVGYLIRPLDDRQATSFELHGVDFQLLLFPLSPGTA